MEQWQKNRTRAIWSFAWLYALLFHQLLPILLGSSSFDSQTFIVITVYFGLITFLFTWMFLFLPAWLVGILLFIFGAFMETFLFGVLPNFWLGGLFYVGMFFLPRWLAGRIWTADKEME
jgi:hypothetical protein